MMSFHVSLATSLVLLSFLFVRGRGSTEVEVEKPISLESRPNAHKFIWKDCGSGSSLARIDSVAFTGCAHSSHMGCRIIRGTNVTASVTFTVLPSSAPIKCAKTEIHAIILHVPIPWSPGNVDACHGCGLSCPLEANTTHTYTLSLNVKKTYPSVRATIEWEVVDKDSDKDLFCFMAPIVVV